MKEQLIKLGYNKWLSDYSEKHHSLKGWIEYDNYLDEVELPVELEYCLIQKWLREVHNINIQILLKEDKPYNEYCYRIIQLEKYFIHSCDGFYRQAIYEEILEEAIRKALTLIK